MFLDKILITIYSLLSDNIAYKSFSKLEYRAFGILTAFLFINLISISNLFNYQIIKIWGKLSVLLVAIIYLILVLVYKRGDKVENLIMKWQAKPNSEKKKSKRILFSYAAISIILLLYV